MTNKINEVVFDYTTKIEKQIANLFGDDQTRTNKALFLLYLINRGTNNTAGYTLNITNHRAFFGCNGTEFGKIFNPLIDNGIVICTSTHKATVKAKTYVVATAYRWAVNTGDIKQRYKAEDYITMPDYIQRFLLDYGVVKGKKHTKWSKNYQFINENNKQKTDNMTSNEEISQLKYQLTMQQELIDSLQHTQEQQAEQMKQMQEQIASLIGEKVEEPIPTVEAKQVDDEPIAVIQPKPVEEPKYNPDVVRICKRHTKNSALIRKIAESVKTNNQVPTKEEIHIWGEGISGANVNKIYTELQEVI